MAPPKFNLIGGSRMPAVGFGTFMIREEKELESALNAALETGYRQIDTAHLYQNEHLIGKVLKKWFDSGKLKREDLFVTTKLPPQGIHPDRVEGFLTKSLKDLQLDYVDLYLVHVPICQTLTSTALFEEVEPTDLVGTWKKLEEQVDLGRTKTIGVSNFNQEQVSRIIANSRIKPVANEIELNAYLQQTEFVKYLQDNGIVPISYFSLGNMAFGELLKNVGKSEGQGFGVVLKDPTVVQIAKKHNKTPAQILLRYLVHKNIAIIPKSITPSRIKENFNLFDFDFDKDDIKNIESLDRGEEARLSLLHQWNADVVHHPEYPFKRSSQ